VEGSLFSVQLPTLAMISLAANILLQISFHIDTLTKELLKWVTIIIRTWMTIHKQTRTGMETEIKVA